VQRLDALIALAVIRALCARVRVDERADFTSRKELPAERYSLRGERNAPFEMKPETSRHARTDNAPHCPL
jgi:hypothetical protein